mmetsp:Transcript_18477/g.71333  ORF Transcript_18477/g.71333 Transcript_18477/m.71333 type:complete len:1096 (+) Transcript_18477:130-3417(+)|eukprot:CAMPEP_0114620164 /NCGR_PEP_ID=MMETSP0168-20121206/8584_1 /TAXON_ID=95228 ORGANISM="Vannella sp., Strain DIVA3 517/6/12" /NCGR_SAMPLE_ID=MMETSP0168 /ASSEMBLY_ACC=CAM_ASM_000044 /LENGTH=1095 /DNA_ID=CAMNT_0001831347 /DNA_START=67 /DNA_END=3354 /DNA_ORIENTATION=-
MDQVVATVAELLLRIQGTDNVARNQAEYALEQLKQTRPDQLVRGELHVIQAENFDMAVRCHAAVILRPQLGRTRASLWAPLQPATKEFVKGKLIECLQQTREPTLLKHLCSMVSSLATTVLDEGIDRWNEVLKFLVEWAKSADETQRTSAVTIFAQLTQHLEDKLAPFYPHLIGIFSAGLADSCVDVRIAALTGVSTFVIFAPQQKEPFQKCIPYMLETITGSIASNNEDKARSALSLLIEPLADCMPGFFSNHIEGLCEAMVAISSNGELQESTRHLAIEFIIAIAEARVTLIQQQPNLLPKFVPVLLSMMVRINDNPRWNEGEKFDVDDSEPDVASESLDRLALALGGDQLVSVLFNGITAMLSDQAWQSRQAALMAISVVGEGCAKVLTPNLDRVMNIIMPTCQDPEPRVRWAFCNTVGQMATDFGVLFQGRYHKAVVTALISLMDDTANPRVQSHAAAAVVNFCDHCKPELLDEYLEPLLSKLYGLLGQQRVIVLEQAITAVASVADCVKAKFVPFYDRFMSYFKSVLLTATTKEFRYLRGKAMEAISLIAAAVGKAVFLPDAKEVLDAMLAVHKSNLAPDDPVLGFMPQAWVRFCKALGESFVPYLPHILPPLIEAAAQKPDVKLFDADDATPDVDEEQWEVIRLADRTIVVNTATIQEKNTACNMLYCYAEELKEHFFPYVGEVAPLSLKLIKFYFNDEIRASAASLIPHLLRSTRTHVEKQGQGQFGFVTDLFNFVFDELLVSIKMEMDALVLVGKLDALQECIEVAGQGCLDQNRIKVLCEAMQSTIQFCAERRKALEQHSLRPDFEVEDRVPLQEMQRRQQDVILTVAEVLGKALKHNSATFLPYFQEMLKHFFPLLAPGAQSRDKQAALFALDDLVEFGGPNAIPIYQPYIQQVVHCVTEADHAVRQAATYGVGVLAQHSGDLFATLLPNVMGLLNQVITAQDSRRKPLVNATENSIAALGKIMLFQTKHIDISQVLPVWLSYLPVNNDPSECRVIYAQLCHFIVAYPELCFGENYKNLPKLLGIFASVLGTELVDAEVTASMGAILKRMAETFPPELMQGAAACLNEAERMKLQACMQPAEGTA